MKLSVFITLVAIGTARMNSWAYTANDGAKTVLTDGSESDTTSGFLYAQAKAQDGWVITIGTAGQAYTWTTAFGYTITNRMTFQGGSTNNRTIIWWDVPAAPNSTFFFAAPSNTVITVKDFIIGYTNHPPYYNFFTVYGEGVNARFSNIKFLNAPYDPVGLISFDTGSGSTDPAIGPCGLIDHCQFQMAQDANYNMVHIKANGYGAHLAWNLPMTWGTTNTVVIEDCVMSQPDGAILANSVCEADAGARLCFRYNLITNVIFSIHGTQSGDQDSTLQVECYNNEWHFSDATATWPFIFWGLGGSSLVFSNKVFVDQGVLSQAWFYQNDCASSSTWVIASCARQLLYPADYPSMQQVGRGGSLSGEISVPCYAWSNSITGNVVQQFKLGADTGDAPFIVQGRDIYTNQPMPGYTPLTYPHPLTGSNQSLIAQTWYLPIRKH